ncbi:hypothetical protein CF65_02691 [Aggregatibacter actinomycetemcomitans HK1651]|nr:hypothetical protein CF65_02691 [Aggregatibacter actinomycetemcomitans HK1651]
MAKFSEMIDKRGKNGINEKYIRRSGQNAWQKLY